MTPWQFETGFKNFKSANTYVLSEIRLADQQKPNQNFSLDTVTVDACLPELYKNQNKKILVTNNWISPSALDTQFYEQLPSSFYGGLYHGNVPIEDVTPSKDFNCLINRMDVIRQSWLYHLVRRDVFHKGYISFNMDVIGYNTDSSPMEVFESQFQNHLTIFETEHKFIKDSLPYRNFDKELSLNQLIMNSKFSVVLETYFDRNEVITYSEKIFRCLKLPRPWLMFAMKNAVQYLRDIGFDVLDDIVNHEYDKAEFGIDRQSMILDQIEMLCKKELTPDIVLRCQQAAEHNQNLLFRLSIPFKQDLHTSINNAINKGLALNV